METLACFSRRRYVILKVLSRLGLQKRSPKDIGERHGFRSICYGHAGDGNLHVNILRDDLRDEAWGAGLHQAISELFTEVRRLGGTLSGEHGIGWVQKSYMPIAFTPEELALQRAIKAAFDPQGILNPQKILLDSGSLT